MAGITFSGLASGIDGDAIIKNMLESKRLATQPMKNIVESNKNENTSLEELSTKLLALRDAVKDFRTLAGSPITKQGVSSDEDAIGVSASSAAIATSTTVEVSNLAQSATVSFDDRFTTITDPLVPGLTGSANITFTYGTGDQQQIVTVPVDSDDTLVDVVSSINEQSGGKLIASVVNTGTDSAPQYALLISGAETGTEKGLLQLSVDAAISAQGVFQTSTLSQAEDAVFTVSGLGTITRSSNKVTGVIPGVTLDLKQENVGPVLVSVSDDREKTAVKMDTMVGALNEMLKFSKEKDAITREEIDGKMTNVYGSLAKTRVDNQAVTSTRNALSDASSNGTGTEVNVLADLGVTIQRDGTYLFDKDVFLEAVGKDAVGATAVLRNLGDQLANTNGVLDQFTKFQGQIDIARDANDEENQMLNDRLERIEANLEKQADTMRLMFSNLESKIGKLNSTSDALTGLIASGFGTGSSK